MLKYNLYIKDANQKRKNLEDKNEALMNNTLH